MNNEKIKKKVEKLDDKEKILLYLNAADGKITLEDIHKNLGITPSDIIFKNMKKLIKEGNLELRFSPETYEVFNDEKMKESEMRFKILTFICRKKICYGTKLSERYELNFDKLLTIFST